MFTALVTPLLLFFGPRRADRSGQRQAPLVAALRGEMSQAQRLSPGRPQAEKEGRPRWESGPLPDDALALVQKLDALGPPAIDKDWTLNRAACQRMDLDENEQIRLQLHLSGIFTRLREAEREHRVISPSRQELSSVTVPAHDETALRQELQDGIYRIVGAAHPAAADALWSFAKVRGDTDFAGFGKNEVGYFIKPYAGEKDRRYSLQRFEYTPAAADGQPREFVTQSASDFDAVPPRYQLLLKGIVDGDSSVPGR